MSTAVKHCGLYLPGHDVHWIQAIHSRRHESERPIWGGHLLEVRPDGLVIIEVHPSVWPRNDGSVHRLWNHDPERLRTLVAANGGKISYQPGYGLLRTASGHGSSYLFCVVKARNPDRQPCPTSPPTGNPIELIRKAGGFSLPGPEALAWAESLGKPDDQIDPGAPSSP